VIRRLAAYTWGSTAEERGRAYPCDHYLSHAQDEYFRALTVRAPARLLFRWLCQLKAAPYSYDWIDNFGRASPRQLQPGMENLRTGQRVMTIFRLVEFEMDRHLTMLLDTPRAVRIFGEIALSYSISPLDSTSCRLVAKLRVRYPGNPLVRLLLPWGDWFMMRKQLLTLRRLAERNATEQDTQ
jgi:hypothetical protein